jgi:release factor glutamine methyltransferase
MIQQGTFFSIPKQAKRLAERHQARESFEVQLCGLNIIVEPGVYQTSEDSELMIESVVINKNEHFLEIGCGTGVISIAIAQQAAHGIGVDVNERAIVNSKRNAKVHGAHNVEFFTSNMFENVSGTFDVIICNPPYTRHAAKDHIDRMFWDPDDEMKKTFFKEAANYLKPGGRLYFGWADFADIDVNLPFVLAEENGYKLMHVFKKPHKDDCTFYVLEFLRKNP